MFLWASGNENCPISHHANVDVPYTHGWAPSGGGSWHWVGVDTARVFSDDLADLLEDADTEAAAYALATIAAAVVRASQASLPDLAPQISAWIAMAAEGRAPVAKEDLQ